LTLSSLTPSYGNKFGTLEKDLSVLLLKVNYVMSTKKKTISIKGKTENTPFSGSIVCLANNKPLALDCGIEISDFPVAYMTYGKLNRDKSNAILICHALTGDQFVAGEHPTTGKPGWWDFMVGPGKTIDTNKYFIICPNILGGCMGTYGPKELNPENGKPWGLDFPVITIADMVRCQELLINYLGIQKLFAVIGGSMGGMQVLEWSSMFSDRLFAAISIASAPFHSAQNIAFHEVGRQAIMADPDWAEGNYLLRGKNPTKGLAVARMAAHITYLSDKALHRKFGRRLQDRDNLTYGFDADFQVESYLRHQGITFVDRFDANSYLYITRAMDYFDLAAKHKGKLANAFKNSPVRFCIISFTSDWLYPTEINRRIVHALNAVAANVSFAEIESDKGHDAFLLQEPEFHHILRGFLDGASEHWINIQSDPD
jgi:homoserine O-acetyltransferase